MQAKNNKEDKLKSEQVQEFILKKLLVLLKFVDCEITEKFAAKLEIILNILLLASTKKQTIHRVCEDHKGTYTGVTVRNTLKLILADIETTERYLNKVLKSLLKRKALRGNPIVCTDVILVEYYGKEEKSKDEIKRAEKRKGTNNFHGYSTVYIRVNGQRYTIAITYVRASDSTLEIIQRLNRYLTRYAIKPSIWLLDSGYYSAKVIKWFKALDKHFLMPLPARGKGINSSKGPTGTNVFKVWTKSGFGTHTIKPKKVKPVQVDVAVAITYPYGRKEKHKVSIYAHFGLGNMRIRDIHELYRKRFSIEVSYRQMHEAKAKTCSRSPVLRYLIVGIAFIIRNAWIFLHYHILYQKQRGSGGRKFDTNNLTFPTLITWIRYDIQILFPLIREVSIEDSARLYLLQ